MTCPLCELKEITAPENLCERHEASIKAGNTLLVACNDREPTGKLLEVKGEHIYGFMEAMDLEPTEKRQRGLVAYIDAELYDNIVKDYFDYLEYSYPETTNHAH